MNGPSSSESKIT